MRKSESPLIPIKKTEYLQHKDSITAFLKSVSWKSSQSQIKKRDINLNFIVNNKALGTSADESLSIIRNLVRISNDSILLSNHSAFVANTLRDGFCLGKHIAELFAKSSGLDQLLQRNAQGNLHQNELPEFHDKTETQCAAMLYTSAHYIVYCLEKYYFSEYDSINLDFGGIPELSLTRINSALSCNLYYYAAYLEKSGQIDNDSALLKLTHSFFTKLSDDILFLKDSLNYIDFFTNNHYQVEGTDFIIKGFETESQSPHQSIEFNKIEMSDIVANKAAKHMYKRYVERLLCYDFETHKNPIQELGGMPNITMGDGKPGTGKSMLIAATASLLHEQCQKLGYQFLFWPLPENIISTYQGGSAERAVEWFKPIRDPNKIVFAPIDDAENNLEERTRQGVSSGVREFIGVFLRNTEGAYAINRGNSLISLFTNIPDQIDKAVLSRIQSRIPIDGAKTAEDFIDQDYIWWKKYKLFDENFIPNYPQSYEFMSSQEELSSINQINQNGLSFNNSDVKNLFEKAEKEKKPGTHEFFGMFYRAIQERYSFFSSRDLRNIQKAVDSRIMDFDMPEIWWEKPNEFFLKNYEFKLNALKNLVIENMKGLSFEEIRLQEAIKYIETAIRINESGLDREIKQQGERIYIQEKAREFFIKNYG